MGELQRQKDVSDAEKLKTQLEEMKRNMNTLQKENVNLKRELELIKKKIERPTAAEIQEAGENNQIQIRGDKRSRKKSSGSLTERSSKKKNSQPTVTPVERGSTGVTIRRELSYPTDKYNINRLEEEEQERGLNSQQSREERSENIEKINSARKSRRRLDSVGKNTKKNTDLGRPNENRKEQPELWTEVLGRKEKRKKSNREESDIRNRKGIREERNKIRKPLKTSAVVITTENREVSYSEVLTWARQTVKLSDEEAKAISTKRAATGGILLEIRGDRNKEIAEKLTDALRVTLRKYQGVRVHRPRQMAEFTLVGLDVSVSRKDIRPLQMKVDAHPTMSMWELSKHHHGGIGFVWVRCPLVEANIIAEKGKIKIGWATVRISMLPARKMQCFKCLRMGHTKARCDFEIDMSDHCYNCEQRSHKSNTCNGKVKCLLCEEDGKAYNHRLRGPRCTAATSKGRIGIFRRSSTKSPSGDRIVQAAQQVQSAEGTKTTSEIATMKSTRLEEMETESMDNSVESELVEDHYSNESVTGEY